MRALDLFAGAGGWGLGADRLGWIVDRVEIWKDARDTARLAGFPTQYGDVRAFRNHYPYDVVIGSPPCGPWAVSGLKAGHALRQAILTEIRYSAGNVFHEDAGLVLEPLRIIRQNHRPTYVALEEVPAVLPVWEAYRDRLEDWGYSVAVGLVNAKHYGVPQDRKRAVLLARRDEGAARIPAPTTLDPISQEAALGLAPGGWIGFPRRDDGRPGGAIVLGGERYRRRDLKSTSLPSFTVTEKARSWTVFGADGSRRPLTLEEASVLQGFPRGYPWQGSRSSAFLQCANAVPPPLAEVLLQSLVA